MWVIPIGSIHMPHCSSGRVNCGKLSVSISSTPRSLWTSTASTSAAWMSPLKTCKTYHPMTPILQTTSVIKNCTVTSGNNEWNFHSLNTVMQTCKPVKLRLKLHKLQNNFLSSWSTLSVVHYNEWCLGVNVNGSRYITSTCVCVCVCVRAGKWTGLKLSLCGLS